MFGTPHHYFTGGSTQPQGLWCLGQTNPPCQHWVQSNPALQTFVILTKEKTIVWVKQNVNFHNKMAQ